MHKTLLKLNRVCLLMYEQFKKIFFPAWFSVRRDDVPKVNDWMHENNKTYSIGMKRLDSTIWTEWNLIERNLRINWSIVCNWIVTHLKNPLLKQENNSNRMEIYVQFVWLHCMPNFLFIFFLILCSFLLFSLHLICEFAWE